MNIIEKKYQKVFFISFLKNDNVSFVEAVKNILEKAKAAENEFKYQNEIDDEDDEEVNEIDDEAAEDDEEVNEIDDEAAEDDEEVNEIDDEDDKEDDLFNDEENDNNNN